MIVTRWFAALPQSHTEAVLHDRLVDHGGTVTRGVSVTGLVVYLLLYQVYGYT